MNSLASDTAMILAAGLGTRMRPLTDTMPKPLVPVAGKPLIDHVFDKLARAGVAQAVVNVHYLPDALEAHLSGRVSPKVTISDERPLLLETGGGMAKACADGLLPDPFFAVNADNLWVDGPRDVFRELSDAWDPARMDALLLVVAHSGAHNFRGTGDFTLDPGGRIGRRVPGRIAPFIYTGIQLVSHRLLRDAPQGPFSTNLLWSRAIEEGRLFGLRFAGQWFEVGEPAAIAPTEAVYKMAETPQVYSIAAHRGFADALVAGLVPRYAEPEFGLARLTLLLPSRRAVRTVSEAFIRFYGAQDGQGGLLMPRMVAIGDLDLDETLGPLFDPLGAGSGMPPAVDLSFRWLRLADLIREEAGERFSGGAALRLAEQMGQAMDRLLVEQIGPEELYEDRVLGLLGEMTDHWKRGLRLFMAVQDRWLKELIARGEVDPADRRNRLFRAAAKNWRTQPPAHPVVAAGVTSAAPLLARLLRVVSLLPKGAVVLPDFDLSLAAEVWDELGVAGAPENKDDPPFGKTDAVTHPQYHLKLLLNRMKVNRSEVQPWHRAGLGKGPPERSHAISSLFLPPRASRAWAGLPPEKRRLSGVRVMTSANPEEEAQAIALLLREALEEPEKRAALVTPDRGLAGRVVAHLARWNIHADDTAGRPLSQTAAGRILLLIAEVIAEQAAPVPLMALLGHPLVGAGEGRAAWLEHARALELRLRGPRRERGLASCRAAVAKLRGDDARVWWTGVEAILAPLIALAEREEAPLAEQIDALAVAGEALCGEALWAQADGRALSSLVEELRRNAREADANLAPAELPTVLRERMDMVAVRPPWGGHPRLAIYGLIEARMSRADLVVCGGLNEGSWPGTPAQDPLLAPAVLRALGVPGGDFRIGLAAHDLAGMLGAPEVVLSRAQRDASGPAIPSRFLLRVEALLGERLLDAHRETRAVALARALNAAPTPQRYERPAPRPRAEQRDVPIGVTALDTLRSDPYQFYARAILGLRRLDALDEEPSAAWKGTLVHEILRRWHEEGGDLREIAEAVLDAENIHPLIRAVWLPRLLKGLEWVEAELLALEGREVIAVEAPGEMQVDGVKIHGRADRIDRLSDGTLAIVDYKTGSPPSARRVKEGFSLQLGLIGMMAEKGGIAGVAGDAAQFEYWSLARKDAGFGYRASPVKTERNRAEMLPEDFLDVTEGYLKDAIGKWIKGDAPFTARLNPNLEVYTDYDQLMRLEEWLGREDDGLGDDGPGDDGA